MIDNELILRTICENKESAEEELIKNNMGLVAGIAKRFVSRGYEIDDLLQIGSLGLLKAIRNFDTAFGVKFSTYAVPLIMGEIRRFIRDDGIIKVSRKHKMNAMKVYMAREKLSQKTGRSPTVSEISQESGLNAEEIIEAQNATMAPESLHSIISEDDDRELMEKVGSVTIEKNIIDKMTVEQSLDTLLPREKQVIELRYFADKTQIEISKIIGVSQVQVSRIEKKALLKMRQFMG